MVWELIIGWFLLAAGSLMVVAFTKMRSANHRIVARHMTDKEFWSLYN
jgi:hypothetical protein